MKLPVLSYVFLNGALLLSGVSAIADDSRPFLVEVTEIHENAYNVRWRIPESVAAGSIPQVELPDTCKAFNRSLEGRTIPARRPLTSAAIYHCQPGLSGQTITIRYPVNYPSVSSLIIYQTITGERHSHVLSPDQSEWRVPDKATTDRVARDYTLLGIQHILGGTDHLLFIICLLWIAGTMRRILITITGFTLAHSFTLALSALDVVTVPVPPMEATIALSIIILAREIIKRQRNSLTWRYPISVSSAFGLLHGFGFAAVLGEIGLPRTELATGLLFFNIGVELGQILFAGTIMLLTYAVRRMWILWPKRPRSLRHARASLVYCTGGIASFWMVERCASFL